MNSPLRSVSGCIAAALVLAACGSSEPDIGSAEPAEPVDSASVESDPAPVESDPAPVESDPAPVETDPAPVETDPAPVDTDPAPVETDPPAADGDCLIGDWIITEAEMNAWYDAVEASIAGSGPAVEFDVVGQTAISFLADATYVYTGEFTLELDLAGLGGGIGTSTGGVSGDWSVADGIVTAEITDSDLSVIVEVAGQTIDGSDLAGGFLASAPVNDTPLDCSGPTLGFMVGEGAARHPVRLTPA